MSILIAKTHRGSWKVLAAPDEPTAQARETFFGLRGKPTHPEFARVELWQRDLEPMRIVFAEPQKQESKRKEKDNEKTVRD